MVNVVSRQSAPRIGQNLIRHPLSGGELGRVVSGGFSCGKYQLCCLDDIAEFFAYVGFSCNVVYIGYKSCLGSDHFGNSSLASGVGMAVVVCKHQRQIACVARYSLIVAAAHKYAVIGYKAVIKDGKAFHIADLCKGSFQVGAFVVKSRKGHKLHAVPVSGKGKCNRIVRIIRSHEFGRVNNDLIHVGGIGVTDLCAADDNALTRFSVHSNAVHIRIHHMYKGIRIRLHVGAFVFWIAGALYIGLGTVADQVVFLAVFNII